MPRPLPSQEASPAGEPPNRMGTTPPGTFEILSSNQFDVQRFLMVVWIVSYG